MSDKDIFLDAEKVWCQTLPGARRGRPGLFLDRDGVVIEDADYLADPAGVALIPGAAEVIAAANAQETPVVLVTNQSGIGRGYYGWDEFSAVQSELLSQLATHGAQVDAVYACAHCPEGRPPYAHPDHPARKPNPGMLLRAQSDLALDLGCSWLVGDKAADLEAACAAGLAGALHVLTGHGAEERRKAEALVGNTLAIRFGASIADAMALLPRLVRR